MASGMNSLILGESASVRFPSRIVPIWVSDPMGFANPFLIASTPATKVVATAPMPGIITPNLPLGGSIWLLWFLTSTCDVLFFFRVFCRFCALGTLRHV